MKEATTATDEGYIKLAAAILKQAKNEFLLAVLTGAKSEIYYYERYFVSDYAQTLSMGHGIEIIQSVKKEAKTGDLTAFTVVKAIRYKFGLTSYNYEQFRKDCKAVDITIKRAMPGTALYRHDSEEHFINAADLPRLYDYISNNLKNYIHY